MTFRFDAMTDLRSFVLESNGIEGYLAADGYDVGSRHYDQHLEAAEMVAAGELWQPLQIHSLLMRGLLESKYVGAYRDVPVWIGGDEAVSPRLVRTEMEWWQGMVNVGPADDDTASRERWCWDVHDRFECVHPFVDGNGRTGRLILNAMRLRYDLPWLTIHVGAEQQRYYRNIDWYRRARFDGEHRG